MKMHRNEVGNCMSSFNYLHHLDKPDAHTTGLWEQADVPIGLAMALVQQIPEETQEEQKAAST